MYALQIIMILPHSHNHMASAIVLKSVDITNYDTHLLNDGVVCQGKAIFVDLQ